MVNRKEKRYLKVLNPWLRRKYISLKKCFGYVSTEYSLKPFEDNECIFIHVPKAAGVSVSKTLFGNLACGHCTVKDYYFLFGKKRYRRMFTFTFVRNPFTRLASAYKFLKEGGMKRQDKKWSNKYLSKYDSINDFVINGLRRKEIQSWVHFKRQVDFLYGENDIDIDFIGKIENIKSDFGYVKRKIGIDGSLSHRNKTKPRGKYGVYSDTSKKIIKKVYESDFEKLGYS